MTGIVEFLTARLDEDEQLAHAACGFHDFKPYGASKSKVYTWWLRAEPGAGEPEDILRRRSGQVVAVIRYLDAAAHIARHDPARVLREVAAKRRVLERHYADDDGSCVGCHFANDETRWAEDIEECPELRDMASVYDDHPDYEQAWRVDG